MDGINASPLGSAIAVPKLTGLDTVTQIVQTPKVGSSLVEKISDSTEELTAMLTKFRNLNMRRARESRKDFNSINIRGLAASVFSTPQIENVDNTSLKLSTKHLSQDELINTIKQFRQEFSQDTAGQYLGLLSLKDKIKDRGVVDDSVNLALAEIDKQLEPAKSSMEFQAATLGYTLIDTLSENTQEREHLQQTLQTSYPIGFDSLEKALEGLRHQFGDNNIQQGTGELYRQLSSQYHGAGRKIDKSELFELMKNMSQLKTMLALFDECCMLAQLLKPSDTTEVSNAGFATQLLHEVTNIQNKTWLEQADMSKMLQHLQVSDITQKNVLGVQLKRILGLIPEHFFREQGQKQQGLNVVFQFMDMMAKREAGHA